MHLAIGCGPLVAIRATSEKDVAGQARIAAAEAVQHPCAKARAQLARCGEDVDALCDYMISNRSRIGSSLIYFRGNHISQDLNAKLCAFGYKIDDLITYNTCAASCFSEDFLYKFHSGEIAAASFYSKETAKNYIKLACEHKLQDNHRQLEAFALSAQIADILLQIKWHRVSVAKKPTEASIVELINSYYG